MLDYVHCILCCPNSETFLDLLLTDLSAKPIDLLPRSIPGVRCSDHSQPSVQRLTKIALLLALLCFIPQKRKSRKRCERCERCVDVG